MYIHQSASSKWSYEKGCRPSITISRRRRKKLILQRWRDMAYACIPGDKQDRPWTAVGCSEEAFGCKKLKVEGGMEV